MTDKIIGFIGGGNMASAIIGGLISSGAADSDHIIASDKSEASVQRLKETFGIQASTENLEISSNADILFLAVKPNMFDVVLPEIRDFLKENTVVVSIAAGQTIEKISKGFGRPVKLIRTMPNTPALVGASMSALCRNELVTDEELAEVQALFNTFGESEVIPEKLMDAVVGVSGSSPAYVYMFIEAMADAAVADGMPRAQACKFAAQSVLGSAKMVLDTGKHPGELKDMVCSPGGTTIEAVAVLEKAGLRSAVIEGQRACVKKSIEMSR
ncbi:MAG: pyrroline-5-carboxylate reductase [Clostridiales bacterium]|nr:pyrroline-5-carboxylate reductase [Clostridiales bacterium]MCD8109892.1 pyrroline-5-carboxylate reductase [Clostridiales bacterium]MCD8132618.1 pyrroline-5-carboxylate reductase [Clostridiales bacterium]